MNEEVRKNNVKLAKKMLKDVEKKIDSWNERSQFKLKGVGNLSRSDMDTLELYANNMIRSNGTGFNGLMKPLGGVAKVFDAYGVQYTGDTSSMF